MSAKNYTNLSKDEIYLISRAEFEKQKIVTTPFVQKLFPNKNKASKTVASLTRKGRIIRLEKGKYIIVPIKAPNQQWTPNEFVVAALWMGDTSYYIGYFTMYNYWGFTEQIPQTVFVLNLKKNAQKTIGDVKYEAVKIDEKKYFGIQKIKVEDTDVCISDKERTLVDFVYNPIGSFNNAGLVEKDYYLTVILNNKVKYPSLVTAKDGIIKIEISLRQPPLDKPVHTVVKHFYQDPFTGEDLFPYGKVLSLSLNEAIAEKLKVAISRKDVAIRDYYDLWHIAESGFDFTNEKFIKLFKRKLSDEGYTGDYRKDFGLSADKLSILHRQVDTDLMPVIRADEKFDLQKVFDRFNQVFSDRRFD